VASIRTKRLSNGKPAYLVRFRAVDGKERSKQFSRRRDAEHFAHVIEIDRMQGSFVDPRLGKLTVEEWFVQWWPTVTNLRPSTRLRNEIAMRTHVLPTFATVPLARVDRTSLREWVAHMSDPEQGGLSPATVAKNVQVFNKLMRAALEDRLISANPLERLPLPRIEREEMRFLTPAEVSKLADAIDPRYRSFVILAGYSGLRLGELLALRWAHIDVQRRQVQVNETLSAVNGQISFGPPKTRAAIRAVGVPGFVIEEFLNVDDLALGLNDLVFASPEGYPIRPTLFRRRFWKPAVEAAGLAPLRIHDLRHTAVALWIAAGGHPKQIAARAGHTSVSVVLDRYGHLLPNHDDALMQALENLGAPASATPSIHS
jgi:integrase